MDDTTRTGGTPGDETPRPTQDTSGQPTTDGAAPDRTDATAQPAGPATGTPDVRPTPAVALPQQPAVPAASPAAAAVAPAGGSAAEPVVPASPPAPAPVAPAGAAAPGPGHQAGASGPVPTTAGYPNAPGAVPTGPYPPGASFGPFRSPSAAASGQPRSPRPPLTVRRGAAAGVVAGALALGLVLGGGTAWGITSVLDRHDRTDVSDAEWPPRPWSDGERPTMPDLPDRQAPGGRPGPGSNDDSSGTGTTSAQTATPASDAQQVGVVTIASSLGYQGGESAGTGMVLTTDGLVLTNHHVVESATSISVTVESTGQTYEATVVGYDAPADVALLQLTDASGLATVTLDDDGGAQVGDTVTAVGNAEGTGDLVAASGAVTGTDETMTASTSSSGSSETLSGLLEFSAAVVGGDSGGPVLDDEGEVVGMTTAASVGGTATVAYAIDIVDAVAVVQQIEAGHEGDGVVLGYPAFLGIGLGTDDGTGARVAGVLDGTPAATAGLAAGDVITAVDGTAVTGAEALTAALAGHEPGDTVTLTWASAATGASTQAAVTLTQGPVG